MSWPRARARDTPTQPLHRISTDATSGASAAPSQLPVAMSDEIGIIAASTGVSLDRCKSMG